MSNKKANFKNPEEAEKVFRTENEKRREKTKNRTINLSYSRSSTELYTP